MHVVRDIRFSGRGGQHCNADWQLADWQPSDLFTFSNVITLDDMLSVCGGKAGGQCQGSGTQVLISSLVSRCLSVAASMRGVVYVEGVYFSI